MIRNLGEPMSMVPSSPAGPFPAPELGEPYLLTPGPLTTAFSVKEAMLRDWGSWDADFRAMTASFCNQLVAMAGDTRGECGS
jgi:2-aminoethylphosphonate-pyruvate transaminase